ncbi:MAG: Eco57I restriction-modification methylase domain-containing protein, partial [Treponema sp.]|nr:Eco57I restriction-modification methylase domain-containing protein [Treponema sp.]
MTEEDKDLLRQYEGAGGLNEAERTTHGTLYEFYTPQKVVDKVWSLVDKYKPYANKDVIEPSAGTGRFAEGRQDNFTLCELDKTSSRIARILHPKAEVRQGYFQELFMNGNTPKKTYDGKKFDIAIGNPPYGAYSGLHRGLGEGKEHTRIEEYFIDRSLDTLKDSGLLAMVVPSSFLRGKNSKAKMQIAKKGKLLEAWRLPNGTFGTTGVGTDLIVIRKEPGDAADYQNDRYFQANADHVAGDETEKMGQYGKMEKYVAPPVGKTFDESLDMINPARVPVDKELHQEVEVKSDAEEHRNRSEAMMGNQNAYKGVRTEIEEEAGTWLDGLPKTSLDAIIQSHLEDLLNAKTDEEKKRHQAAIEAVQYRLSVIEAAKRSKIEPEKHDNRSRAMMGNQNAKKDGVQADDIKNQIKDINAKIRELEKNQRADYKMAQMQDKLDEDILAFQAREAGKAKQKEIDELKRQKVELTAQLPKEIPTAPGAQSPKEGKKRIKKGDEYTPSIGKNMTSQEFNAKYGKHFDKTDLPVWKVTDYTGVIDIAKLTPSQRRHVQESGKFVTDVNGNWVSRVNYASGNIYEKLDQLEADKELIVKTRGEGVYKNNKAILEAALPALKTADNFTIPPTSDFAKEYNSVDEDGNVVNIRSSFFRWARINMRNETVDWDSSPVSKSEIPPHITMKDIIDYINQVPIRIDRATAREFDKKTARMEADKKREERREAAERIFTRFIREGLSPGERTKLEKAWNRRFNAIVNPDYTQIPLFIEGMNTHKGKKEFDLTEQQIKGISFLCNKGNGIPAYDVGVGKTVVGAAATVNQIQAGRAKKPLLMVPKAVYKKWIKEVKQHFPLVKINELGNFSDRDISKLKNENGGLSIELGTISICTYEALNKVTFKPETLSGDLAFDMMDSQTIYDEAGVDNRSDRQKEQEHEKVMEM